MARRPTAPLLVALVCLVALALTAALALGSPAVHERDAAMLHGFMGLDRPRLHGLFEAIAGLGGPLPYAIFGLGLAAGALAQRRPWRAGAVLVLLIVTGVSTRVVKISFAEPRVEPWLPVDRIGENAWPSGHATAAMTLALCAVLVAPHALRAVAAVAGGLFAAGVGYAIIVLAWHYPSDVVGGYLMAAMWTALVLAGLRVVEGRRGTDSPAVAWGSQIRLWVAAGAAALAAALVVASARESAALYAAERPTLVLGALVLAAVAGALAAVLARAA